MHLPSRRYSGLEIEEVRVFLEIENKRMCCLSAAASVQEAATAAGDYPACIMSAGVFFFQHQHNEIPIISTLHLRI